MTHASDKSQILDLLQGLSKEISIGRQPVDLKGEYINLKES